MTGTVRDCGIDFHGGVCTFSAQSLADTLP